MWTHHVLHAADTGITLQVAAYDFALAQAISQRLDCDVKADATSILEAVDNRLCGIIDRHQHAFDGDRHAAGRERFSRGSDNLGFEGQSGGRARLVIQRYPNRVRQLCCELMMLQRRQERDDAVRGEARCFGKTVGRIEVFRVGELVETARQAVETSLPTEARQIAGRDPRITEVLRPRDSALSSDIERFLGEGEVRRHGDVWYKTSAFVNKCRRFVPPQRCRPARTAYGWLKCRTPTPDMVFGRGHPLSASSNYLGDLYRLGAAFLADQKLNDAWEPVLARWERAASTTEDEHIKRAARMVREAIADNAWLTSENVTVEPQGSYHNNTNVRLEADMDLRVVLPLVQVEPDPQLKAANDHARSSYSLTGRSGADVANELRRHVGLALATKFGKRNVDPGKKAFRVSAVPGSRADIDIVPALTLDYITLCRPANFLASPYIGPVRGIAIHGADGSETWNFPLHHHRFGKAKHERTDYGFKKVVRQLKSLRDDLVEEGIVPEGVASSFLIECLAYRVEDEHYTKDITRRARLKRVLNRSNEQLADPAWIATAREINDWKLLFGNHQPWKPIDAQTFVALALEELDT